MTYTPSPEAVEAFKAAWHQADAEDDEGTKLALTILLSDINFRPLYAGRGDGRRMCEPCWAEEGQ